MQEVGRKRPAKHYRRQRMTCNEHRGEEQFAAYCPFCLAKYWEGYAHKIESERDRLRAALKRIADLDYSRASINGVAYLAVAEARAALQEVGDE
jgi:hypothetical protein